MGKTMVEEALTWLTADTVNLPKELKSLLEARDGHIAKAREAEARFREGFAAFKKKAGKIPDGKVLRFSFEIRMVPNKFQKVPLTVALADDTKSATVEKPQKITF